MDDVFVVGVGASAGGVGALRDFFRHVPSAGDLAYVAILHLSPEYDSHLPEVLQADCPLPVVQIHEATRIESNHVYVISPNQSLTMADGYLTPSTMLRQEERRAPIDIFFRTLADARGSYSACVVLSGTGADGSVGIKRVKEHGGLCVVQRPEEAEHPDMPRNAIATGLVDDILPVAQIPARIVAFVQSLGEVKVADSTQRHDSDERAIRDIFSQLRVRTGHDFINYKRSTMWRRLERRLAVHGLPDVAAYAQFLRDNPGETQALLKDLLISVTNFFRDRAVFETLERVIIPKLFERKTEEDHLRVWVAGCATGEEAYSIAMLLSEHSSNAPGGPTTQVFATDIDDAAIAVAREALYGANDVVDVSAERLRRFFTKEGEFYRVRKEVREMVLFARHNVIKDPPFSHLDLVTCRNLLIYLNRSAQQRVLELLHFGLRPGGYLFLGQSESVEGAGNLFVPVDKEANIYQSREMPLRPMIGLPESVAVVPSTAQSAEERVATRARERISYADLHQRLLEEYAPPSIVVDEDYEMLHVSETAAQYLQFAGGEPSANLLKAIRPELRLDLQTALYQARQQRARVDARHLRLTIGIQPMTINISVRPVLREGDTVRGFFLVLFEPVADGVAPPVEEPATVAPGDATRQLEDEVQRLRAQLRATVEQHEIQSEELKASNEELQAMNEELRSTAEELETGKEELQSVNEELTTVNQELKIKIEEQAHADNDVQNLINTTEIAAVFLDRSARIKLFSPRARDMFHLIPSDRGRPLSDIHSPFEYDELHADIARVLERLERVQREVRTHDDRWHLMQIMPYRTSDDRIDGVVLTFVDVTQQKSTEARIQRNEAHLRSVLDSITDHALITIDADGTILNWNVGAEQVFGFTASEAVGQSTSIIFTPEDRQRGAHLQEIETAQTQGRAVDERWHQRKDGSRLFVSGVLSRVGTPPAKMFVKVARDLTARKQSEDALQQSHSALESAVEQRTAELRDLLSRLITVQEDERRRIARDLHDDIGQKMTALHLKLDALRRGHPAGSDLESQVQQAQAFVQQLDRDLDFFTWELRPAALYDLGLAQALRDFVTEWSKNYGVAANFQTVGLGGRLRLEQEIHFYRIAQEALNNVHKHAQAKNVDVTLQRRDGSVVLTIEDDGVGMQPSGDNARGMGLINMRERAALMHGTVEFERPASGGSAVIVRAPIALQQPQGKGSPGA